MSSFLVSLNWITQGCFFYGTRGFNKSVKYNKNIDYIQDIPSDLSNSTFIVTGANAGIGRSVVEELVKRKGRVHLICRNKEKGLKAIEEIKEKFEGANVELHIVDVSKLSEIRKFAGEYNSSQERLDCLINSAGVMPKEKIIIPKENDEDEELDLCFSTNLLGGTFLMTNLLIPSLKRTNELNKKENETMTNSNNECKKINSRVVNVSSGGMYTQKLNLDDLQFNKSYDGVTAYAQTKRGQIIITDLLAEKYKNLGITFNSMHPGWCSTDGVKDQMPKFYSYMERFFRTSEEGADTIVFLATSPKCENITGEFWFDRAITTKHLFPYTTDSSTEDKVKFWNECCRLTKLNSEEIK